MPASREGNDREHATIYTCGAVNEERRGGFAAIVSWEHETGDMRSTITGGSNRATLAEMRLQALTQSLLMLANHPALEDAVVTIHDDGGLMARSVAMGIPENPETANPEQDLWNELKERLANHKVTWANSTPRQEHKGAECYHLAMAQMYLAHSKDRPWCQNPSGHDGQDE
jgi:hypothetical protein